MNPPPASLTSSFAPCLLSPLPHLTRPASGRSALGQVPGLSRLPPSKKGGEQQGGAGKAGTGGKGGSTAAHGGGGGAADGREAEDECGKAGGEYALFYGSMCCERAGNTGSKRGDLNGGGQGSEVGSAGGGRALRRIDLGERQTVMRALGDGEPFILTGLDVGPCVGRWSAQHLHAAAGDKPLAAGVHVCAHKTVDLAGHRRAGTRKNFHFVEMPFGEFIQRCAPSEFEHLPPLAPVLGAGERLYLRSVATGAEASRTPSHLPDTFPELAADVVLPHGVIYDADSYHSSVLRVASGDTELWTHYDVMHNMLIQVTGTKHVTLWPPSQDANLYTEGSSSRVPNVHEPDLARFPRFSRTYHTRVTGLLRYASRQQVAAVEWGVRRVVWSGGVGWMAGQSSYFVGVVCT